MAMLVPRQILLPADQWSWRSASNVTAAEQDYDGSLSPLSSAVLHIDS